MLLTYTKHIFNFYSLKGLESLFEKKKFLTVDDTDALYLIIELIPTQYVSLS